MRLLFLTTRLPFPPVGGERLRPYNFIKYLSSSNRITLLSFIESNRELESLRGHKIENLQVRTVLLPRFRSHLNCLGSLFSKQPLELAYYASPAMRSLVKEEITRGGYDLVFCHLLRMAGYAKDYGKIKKVLDLTDALSLRYGLSQGLRKGPFKFIERLESARLKAYEPQAVSAFDLKIVSSSLDKAYLEKEEGIKDLCVVENGAEPKAFLQERMYSAFPKVIFFANFRAFPNQDAALYFYKDIFPLVRQRVQGVKFVLAGSGMPASILRLKQDSSIEVFEEPAELNSIVCASYVSVAPMRIAAGIQNKIIQSMALGVPVVTTTRGLGGISAAADKEVLLADTPSEFADKVVTLLNDGQLRDRIALSAYRLVKEKYTWPAIVQELNDRLAALVSKR